MKTSFTIGVFGIVCNEQHEILLCLRHDISKWNLPWWILESGESPWEWVVREIREETGLDTEVESLLGIYSKPDQDDIVFVFRCRVIDGIITKNEEAKDIRYFARHMIPENTLRNHRVRIEDFFSSDELVMGKQ